MGLVTVLVLLPLVQNPPADPDRFVWPPVRDQPLSYTVRLEKTRRLSDDLFRSVREARRAAGLHTPSRQPRQAIALQIDVVLACGRDEVEARYTTRLIGKPTLRMKLHGGEAAGDVDPLGNDRLAAVWGLADTRRSDQTQVPRGAMERSFAQRFRRDGKGRATPTAFGRLYGDHLLPVLWDQPLPCWVGQMASVVELAGEAAIEGKSLIRDGSASFPLGHRETRVELEFIQVAAGKFTVSYRMRVRQVVAKTRDLKSDRGEPYDWIFEIDGVAEYAANEQAFERIRETVKAWPEKLAGEGLARVRDEAFEGTIEIERVRDDPKGKGGRRRR